MKRRILLLTIASFFAMMPALAQTAEENAERTRWDAAWEHARGQASAEPSQLARKAVEADFVQREGEAVEARAARAFAYALRVEESLRLGYTCQEARARLRQELRLEASEGAENGKRMAARIAKTERLSKAAGAKTGAAGGSTLSGSAAGKGKSGR